MCTNPCTHIPPRHMSRGQRITCGKQFSPSTMCALGDQTQVVRLGSGSFYSVSHLSGPKPVIYKLFWFLVGHGFCLLLYIILDFSNKTRRVEEGQELCKVFTVSAFGVKCRVSTLFPECKLVLYSFTFKFWLSD